jgi:hypothetical protein
MKKAYFSCVVVILGICLLNSVAWSASKGTLVTKPGYIMFNDQYAISGDGKVYKDCSLDGTDMVEIRVWSSDGSFGGMELYIGVMYKKFYKCSTGQFSPSRLKFNFNVSGITGGPTGNAVRDILRWYKDANGVPQERCESKPGYIFEGLHVPLSVNVRWIPGAGDDQVQFGIDPDPTNPGTDARSVTQDSVNNYYTDDDNTTYFCTRTEPNYELAPYVVYIIDYGDSGFNAQPVAWSEGKKPVPVTWIVEASGPASLFVIKDDYTGGKVDLTHYPSLPFEFAVSLKPITSYPVTAQAPPKVNTISTTWSEIKGE